jgi:chromosome segregation ATPase
MLWFMGDVEYLELVNRLASVDKKLDKLLKGQDTTIRSIQTTLERTMSQLDDALDELTAQVKANTDAEASATALIQGLAEKIEAQATDPQAVRDLAARLKATAEVLSAAVVANTPSDPDAAGTLSRGRR